MPLCKTTVHRFEPDYAVAPRETLRETMGALGMDQPELARRTGLSLKIVNQIVKGKHPITLETALKLEHATGVPARMWSNLELDYQEQMARLAERERLAKQLDWLKRMPVAELLRRKVIAEQPDKTSLLRAMLTFFGVTDVPAWEAVWLRPAACFRKSTVFASKPGPIATWLRLGELQAQKIDCQEYDPARFKAALQAIRNLTVEPPERFVPEMQRLCAQAGVAVVFVPEIKGAPVCGAARWLCPGRAIIQLSLRYKREDHFWFSFFHEAGHILHGAKKEVFIHSGQAKGPQEDQADAFARDVLIPPAHAKNIPLLRTAAEVRALAKSIAIAPGIVAGRFQHETRRHDCFHALIRGLQWDDL